MNNQDPIADMLTRIRNANRVGRRMVLIPKSKICAGIAQVLKDEGYIEDYDVIDDSRQQTAQIALRTVIGTNVQEFNRGVAAALLVALPVVALLVAFQRQIIRGLTAGAVKG